MGFVYYLLYSMWEEFATTELLFRTKVEPQGEKTSFAELPRQDRFSTEFKRTATKLTQHTYNR